MLTLEEAKNIWKIREANKGKKYRVFDWDKAAKILKENNVKNAEAGLSGDWDYTSGTILEDGKIPTKTSTYLASNWAIPQLQYDDKIIDCFIMEDETEWDMNTFWPESAKKHFTNGK